MGNDLRKSFTIALLKKLNVLSKSVDQLHDAEAGDAATHDAESHSESEGGVVQATREKIHHILTLLESSKVLLSGGMSKRAIDFSLSKEDVAADPDYAKTMREVSVFIPALNYLSEGDWVFPVAFASVCKKVDDTSILMAVFEYLSETKFLATNRKTFFRAFFRAVLAQSEEEASEYPQLEFLYEFFADRGMSSDDCFDGDFLVKIIGIIEGRAQEDLQVEEQARQELPEASRAKVDITATVKKNPLFCILNKFLLNGIDIAPYFQNKRVAKSDREVSSLLRSEFSVHQVLSLRLLCARELNLSKQALQSNNRMLAQAHLLQAYSVDPDFVLEYLSCNVDVLASIVPYEGRSPIKNFDKDFTFLLSFVSFLHSVMEESQSGDQTPEDGTRLETFKQCVMQLNVIPTGQRNSLFETLEARDDFFRKRQILRAVLEVAGKEYERFAKGGIGVRHVLVGTQERVFHPVDRDGEPARPRSAPSVASSTTAESLAVAGAFGSRGFGGGRIPAAAAPAGAAANQSSAHGTGASMSSPAPGAGAS